ncbi:MAG: hypothetical protein NC331_11530 [Lachnospiraceae bacterium]|nr:hypothetical protein [Lachnospiraceae bacterium]MCM1239998.1 hypothetical protein [Lachnospiraceae bacterium]
MQVRIAVADNDKEYLDRLVSVLEEYKDLVLSVYTDADSLETALTSRKFDIILFDSDLYDGQTALNKDMLAVMLLDDAKAVPAGCGNCHKVNKYQRISNIYKQILEMYSEVCQDVGEFMGRQWGMSVAFYSPIGGCGKTTLALVAASKLAMRGYKTFYINLEDIASEDCYLPQSDGKGLSELVGSLGSGINFPMKLQSLLQTKSDNLYYLKHFDSPNDIYAMTAQDIGELLTEISRSGLFEYIVVDMGVALDARALSIFEQVEKIILVEKPDAIAIHKMQCFTAQAHVMNAYSRKMLRVLNFDNGRGMDTGSPIPLAGRVGGIQNPDSAQLITMLAGNAGVSFVEALVSH